MKILGSLIASAALTSAVLVAVPAANAAPYPGSVATTTSYKVPATVKSGHKLNVQVRARTTGNARVLGRVLIRVYQVKRGHDPLIRSVSVYYHGSGYHKVAIRAIQTKGHYTTQAFFQTSSSSVYKRSHSGVHGFRVR